VSSSSFTREAIVSATATLHSERRSVRFHDVDAAGTIYFPRVLEYFSDAYLALITSAGMDVPDMLRNGGLAAPLAHAEADYFAPLFFGDTVDVDVVLARIGSTSVAFAHRLRKADGRVAAVGQTVHVFIDTTSFKPVPIPETLTRYLTGKPGVTSAS
jgi:YbgC/YbaW family acyl-CoA thioester hydrolase